MKNQTTNARIALTAIFGIFVALLFAAAPAQSKQLKVDICHNDFLISVALPAVAAHIDHGDYQPDGNGDCEVPLPDPEGISE